VGMDITGVVPRYARMDTFMSLDVTTNAQDIPRETDNSHRQNEYSGETEVDSLDKS